MTASLPPLADRAYRPGAVNRERPVLLLADQSWNSQGGGAVILRDLLGDALGDGIVWVTPSQTESDSNRCHYGLSAGSAGRGDFSVVKDILWNARRLSVEVAEIAARVNAAGVWVVLHGASVAIAANLVRERNLPVHATVHDDPVYATALRSRRLALLLPIIAKQFKEVLLGAQSVDVICQRMADRYKRKYGVDCAVLHRGLRPGVAPAPKYSLIQEGLKVGILGNIYSASSQLVALTLAVERAAVRLSIQPRLLVCGGGSTATWLRQKFAGRVEIETPGHVSEAEGIEQLRGCGILYLNYPFGRLHRVFRESSFPTKLSTYVCAARPILIHAPPRSSLSDIPAGTNYALIWQTLNPADGATKLVEFFSEPSAAESRHLPAELVRRRYFDLATHRATLDRFLGGLIDPSFPRKQ
jgi:hypothetical protein